MKTVIVIHTYISNEHMEDMVYKNVQQIKKFNLPILITSNFLSTRIQKLVDHCYIYKENLLFKNDYKNYHWVDHYYYTHNFQINSHHPDKQPHGLVVMHALYKGISLANILGYDYVIRIEWDNLYDDDDIVNLKNFYHELLDNKSKDALLFTHDHSFYGRCVHIFAVLIFKTKYFLKNYPYFENENDYVKFLSENKFEKFLPFEKLLHMCFLEKNKENIIEYDHVEKIKYLGKNTMLNGQCTQLNWPEPCTKTTKKIFCKSNEENNFYIFSENVSYFNEENPNWQTVNYKINTQFKEISISHTVNTGCWQLSTPIIINENEFPIKFIVDDKEIVYNTINDIYNTITFL